MEQWIDLFNEIKKYKDIIAHIDKDFFIKMIDNMLNEYNNQLEINEEHRQMNSNLNCAIKELEEMNEIKKMAIVAKDREIEELKNKIKDSEEVNRIYALEGSKVALELYIKDNYIPKRQSPEEKQKLNEAIDYFNNNFTFMGDETSIHINTLIKNILRK